MAWYLSVLFLVVLYVLHGALTLFAGLMFSSMGLFDQITLVFILVLGWRTVIWLTLNIPHRRPF